MPYIRMNTLIDKEQYEEAKKEGITIKHLIKLGYLAWKNNPQLIKRIGELETQMQQLQATDRRLYGRIDQIQR